MKSSLKKYICFLAVKVKVCLKNKYGKDPKPVDPKQRFLDMTQVITHITRSY